MENQSCFSSTVLWHEPHWRLNKILESGTKKGPAKCPISISHHFLPEYKLIPYVWHKRDVVCFTLSVCRSSVPYVKPLFESSNQENSFLIIIICCFQDVIQSVSINGCENVIQNVICQKPGYWLLTAAACITCLWNKLKFLQYY